MARSLEAVVGGARASEQVEVNISNVAGEIVFVGHACFGDTVGILKKMTFEEGGPPPELQSLIFKENELLDESTLEEVGIKSGDSCVTMVVSVALVDRIIRDGLENACPIQHDAEDLAILCSAARSIILRDPSMLELSAPLTICGDLFGHYDDLLSIFNHVGMPPDITYLCLGNYVDKGKRGLDVIALLLAYKVKYPKSVYLLRGNHEDEDINRIYGFYDTCRRLYRPIKRSVLVWKQFNDVFKCLPLCALVGEKILCVHGGLSPELSSFDQIRKITRPTAEKPNEDGLLCDLLWSSFVADQSGWAPSDRGVGYDFGIDICSSFMEAHGLRLVCRSHHSDTVGDPLENGYRYHHVDAEQAVLTLVSCRRFGMGFTPSGAAVMHIDRDLQCTFSTFT